MSERTASQTSAETAVDGGSKGDRKSKRFQWFWHPAVRNDGKQTAINTLKGLLLITVVLWTVLPIFWGSTYLLLRYFHRLTVAVVDFDSAQSGNNALVGPAIIQMAERTNAMNPNMPRLGYNILPASYFPGGLEDVKANVGYSNHWGAIVANANCTTQWQSALQTGDSSYDPTGCVSVIYATARFYQIVLLYLAQFMVEAVHEPLQEASKQAVSNFLSENANNANALALAAQVPQAIGTAFGYHLQDVRQIHIWSVAAIFEASLIYYLIFAFHLAVWSNAARTKTGFNKKTTYLSLLAHRIALPAVFYIPISLWYTVVIKAWQIPSHSSLGAAGGFFAMWALNYCTILALGLALESMMSLLGPQLLPFFLMFWIIFNLTSSFTPLQLTEKFYRLMRMAPFYHTVQGYKIITHNTRPAHHLGLNFGVLIAIIAVDCCGMALFIAIERRRSDKNERKEQEEKEKEESGPKEKPKKNNV